MNKEFLLQMGLREWKASPFQGGEEVSIKFL